MTEVTDGPGQEQESLGNNVTLFSMRDRVPEKLQQNTRGRPTKEQAKAIEAFKDEAWAMRARGMSYTEIAKELGLSYDQVHRLIKRAARKLDTTSMMQGEFELDIYRVNELIQTYYPSAVGRAYRPEQVDQDPNYEHANFILRLMQHRAQMLGFYAPKKIDVRMIIRAWAEKEGLDPDDVVDVVGGLISAVQ